MSTLTDSVLNETRVCDGTQYHAVSETTYFHRKWTETFVDAVVSCRVEAMNDFGQLITEWRTTRHTFGLDQWKSMKLVNPKQEQQRQERHQMIDP